MAALRMIDLADFASINKDMADYDEKREKVIKDSRGMPHVCAWLPIGMGLLPAPFNMTSTCAAQIYRSSQSKLYTAFIEGTWMAQHPSWRRLRMELRS